MSADAAASSDTARLFLALWPGPAVLRALLEHRAGWAWNASALLARPEQLHLTLHFIGPVVRARLPELIARLRLVPIRDFELRFGLPELWPHGIAALRPIVEPLGLVQLHAALREALLRLELPIDARTFRPHVTLARHASGAHAPAQPSALAWQVHGFALAESRSGTYVVLHRFA